MSSFELDFPLITFTSLQGFQGPVGTKTLKESRDFYRCNSFIIVYNDLHV